MTKLTIGDDSYFCHPDETVLDVLLRHDVDATYACKKGTCHSCILRSTDATPPAKSQDGLKATLKIQKYFLACQCVPVQDMTIKLPEQSAFFTAGKVIANDSLNRNTRLLIVACTDVIEYSAGQFVNLQRADGLTRSYSISNTPQKTNTLEFHIRCLPGGRFSEWVHNDLKVGDRLSVSEPLGHCFYIPERKQQGILLVGTGSGLAPLVGILDDALLQGHSGPIYLFHGSRVKDDLYRIDELQQLAEQTPNFYYRPCISGENEKIPENFNRGRANDVALSAIPDLSGWRVFLCGHPDMINQMKRDAFLKGASMADIYTDAFHLSAS
jgi:NAD(P)H-flavin reductase/ferredoxin